MVKEPPKRDCIEDYQYSVHQFIFPKIYLGWGHCLPKKYIIITAVFIVVIITIGHY
jgi:hypothetical protein